MKFVVLVPWWVYALFIFVMIAIGGAVLYVGLILLVIYLLFTRPGLIIGLGLIGLSFRYWYVTVPLLIALFIYEYVKKKKESVPAEKSLIGELLKDTKVPPSQDASDEPMSSK
jgi:hypothetical protein